MMAHQPTEVTNEVTERSPIGGLIGLLKIDHLGIAVRSIADAAPLFITLLGGVVTNGGDDPKGGIRTLQLTYPGGFRLELVEPLRDDSGVARFLSRRGQGLHHVTVMVKDIDVAIESLLAADFELVDTDTSNPQWRATYIRPRSGFGALFQIVESPIDWSQPVEGMTLDRIVNGEVTW